MIRLDTYPCHAIFLCVSPTTFACRTIDGLRPSLASRRRPLTRPSVGRRHQLRFAAAVFTESRKQTDGRTREKVEGQERGQDTEIGQSLFPRLRNSPLGTGGQSRNLEKRL